MENNSISVRIRDGGDLKDITVIDFIHKVKEDNTLRR